MEISGIFISYSGLLQLINWYRGFVNYMTHLEYIIWTDKVEKNILPTHNILIFFLSVCLGQGCAIILAGGLINKFW